MLPKLNIVAVYKLLCLFHSRVIVVAFEGVRVERMAIGSDNVNAIFRHGTAPFDQAGAQNSLSPNDAEGEAAISLTW
jgi:hypothetical protein